MVPAMGGSRISAPLTSSPDDEPASSNCQVRTCLSGCALGIRSGWIDVAVICE